MLIGAVIIFLSLAIFILLILFLVKQELQNPFDITKEEALLIKDTSEKISPKEDLIIVAQASKYAKINELEIELDEAIDNEDYIRAAKIRDIIKNIKNL